ncbi:rab GTPase-binding effector protein 1-like [Diadema setosum]|uniref:rab GTPase-binding effector protein 1-like n=1 Tax=Diadema setosum TaxID=31175 RepID=UPI003B3AE08A
MAQMDEDPFTVQGRAEPDLNCGEVLNVQQRVSDLESTLQAVLQEKKLQEEDFAQKRAKFKELYLAREQELIKEVENIREEKKRLTEELAGLKAAAAVIESSKEDEINEIKQKWADEVASLQQIVTHTAAITAEETAMTYQMERDKLLSLNERLTQELQELSQNQTGGERGMTSSGSASLLTSMTKSFRNLTSATSPSPTREEKPPPQHHPPPRPQSDSLEQSMLKAQKDTELLRAVVVPLEAEIEALKNKLSDATNENRLLHSRLKKATGGKDISDAIPVSESYQSEVTKDDIVALNDKIKDMNKVLEIEKAARVDLELYVAVLDKQKKVMQDEGDQMRDQLKDVCKILEQEKQAHSQLQQTWQMANDQFLESQRLQMMDMRRMESVLTEEQQRQIQEIMKKDREREQQEEKVRALQEKRESMEKRHSKEQEVAELTSPESGVSNASSSYLSRDDIEDSDDALLVPTSVDTPISSTPSRNRITSADFAGPNVDPEELLQFDTVDAGQGAGSGIGRGLSEIGAQSGPDSSGMLGVSYDTVSLSSAISLTEAQERAMSGTPESEEMKSVLASARSKTDLHSLLAGKRIVSDTEWTKLQDEIRFAREKLGRPCDMCTNYEQQLQGVQTKYLEATESTKSLRLQLEQEIDNVLREQKMRSELEESLKNAAEDAQTQITTLTTKNSESEQLLSTLRQQYLKSQSEIHSQMQILFESREQLYQEVTKLQKENDSLSAKRSLHQSIQSSEPFVLPTALEELERLCLKYREDIITVRVNADHTESSLRSELSFTREQLESEQHQRMTMEDTYQTELDDYKEELLMLRSLREEHEKEKKARAEAEDSLKELQESKKTLQSKSKEIITALKDQVEDLGVAKVRLETDLQEQKSKVQNLQADLVNSEAVQMDFVKLSQSLQVQLEMIRQKDNEVRWQHEDDVDKCNKCRTAFGASKKKKHHCKHCGKIFCPDCLGKAVESGPRRRKMPVCDVCHTLLVNESAPYFSKEAPDNT